MEMTLNYSGAFCELDCDELEFVNGGITYSQAVLLAGVVIGVVGVCLLCPPLVALLGISTAVANTCGGILTVVGLTAAIIGAASSW